MTHHHLRCGRNLLPFVLLLGSVFVLSVTAVAAQGGGVIEGQVVNQSDKADQPASIPITLLVFKDMALQASTEITSTADGKFQFADLDTSGDLIYQVAAEYRGLSYLTDFLMFENDKIPPVTLAVYEPTTDTADVSIERLHLIVEVQPRKLRIGQLYVFSNTGDRTYIGDLEQSSETLRFTLPDGASDLEFQEGALGGRFVEAPGGFADTSPVVPGIGTQQVLFSYDLDFDAPEYELVVTNYYSVTGVNVLVSDPTATVDSPVLKSEGLRNMQGQEWLGLVGKDLAPHQLITLTFANLPLEMSEMAVLPQTSVPVASRASTLTFVVLGLILFGLGVLVGYKLPRGEDAASPGSRTGTSAASGASEEDDLIVALADLDDAYERGELPPHEYQAQREELKRQLTERFEGEGD